jgi:hypothetical protein
MRLLLFILSVMVLSSCGPAYHLRKAKKHLLLAEAKGASITADTIFRDVPVPQVRVDTTVKFITLEKLLHDHRGAKQDGGENQIPRERENDLCKRRAGKEERDHARTGDCKQKDRVGAYKF